MKTTTGWLVAVVLLVAVPVDAQQPTETAQTEAQTEAQAEEPDRAVRERVETLLGGIERVPTPADWEAIGADAVAVLVDVLTDTDRKVVTRGRAAIGLGHFDDEAGKEALRKLLRDGSTPTLLVRKAIVALARADGANATIAVASHLGHRSKRVREQAIKTLGELRTRQAHDLLEARRAAESSDYLRDLISQELKKPVAKIAAGATSEPTSVEDAQAVQ